VVNASHVSRAHVAADAARTFLVLKPYILGNVKDRLVSPLLLQRHEQLLPDFRTVLQEIISSAPLSSNFLTVSILSSSFVFICLQ
jgi:hypothetical protein